MYVSVSSRAREENIELECGRHALVFGQKLISYFVEQYRYTLTSRLNDPWNKLTVCAIDSCVNKAV